MFSNEILWIILLFINFGITLLAYRLFGKYGLYSWTAVSLMLANLQVMKTVSFFSYVTAMGNIVYGTTFFMTDILSENHGRKSAKKAVWIGFFTLISMTIIMQLCLNFTPHASDTSQAALETLFGFMPRIAFASITAYLISQTYDIFFYHHLKKIAPKRLWIRNNGSTMLSQLIDNIIFTVIAFTGVFSLKIMMEIFIVSYITKFIVALLDTPFLYIAKGMKR